MFFRKTLILARRRNRDICRTIAANCRVFGRSCVRIELRVDVGGATRKVDGGTTAAAAWRANTTYIHAYGSNETFVWERPSAD